MKRTSARAHIEFDELDPIEAGHAPTDGTVSAHANPIRRARRITDPRDERHTVRMELHELERTGAVDEVTD